MCLHALFRMLAATIKPGTSSVHETALRAIVSVAHACRDRSTLGHVLPQLNGVLGTSVAAVATLTLQCIFHPRHPDSLTWTLACVGDPGRRPSCYSLVSNASRRSSLLRAVRDSGRGRRLSFQANSSCGPSSIPTIAGPLRRRGPMIWAGRRKAAACSGVHGHSRILSSSGGARPVRFRLFGE